MNVFPLLKKKKTEGKEEEREEAGKEEGRKEGKKGKNSKQLIKGYLSQNMRISCGLIGSALTICFAPATFFLKYLLSHGLL